VPDRYFDELVLLNGHPGSFTEGDRFRGGLVLKDYTFCTDDGIPHVVYRYRLTHEDGVTLRPGDWVRRVRDDAEFLVTGADETTTPAVSNLDLAMTAIERTVYAR